MTHASVLAVSLMIGVALFSGESIAQEPPKAPAREKQERKEIIIRQKEGGKEKMTIVVDGDQITVNGKPISQYQGDDIVIRKIREVEMSAPRVYARPRVRAFTAPQPMEPFIWEYNSDDSWPGAASRTPRAYLGVITEKAETGARISQVSKGTPAEKAGFKEGDIITSVAGKKVEGPESLAGLVRSHKPDEELEIGYIREKKKKTVRVKLGSTGAFGAQNFEFRMQEIDPQAFEELREMAPLLKLRERELDQLQRSYGFEHRGMERAQRELEKQHRELEKMYRDPEAFRFEFDHDLNRMTRPKIGMRVTDMESGGVKITEVEPGSPADKAGLRKDDVLAYIDGKKIDHTDQAVSGLQEGREKITLPVTVMRDGKPLNVEVKMPRDIKQANL